MCQETERVNVKISANLSHTGKEIWKKAKIDKCIAPIVRALQESGIDMKGSCCGHDKEDGMIILQDGRVLSIENKEKVRMSPPTHHKGFPFYVIDEMIRKFIEYGFDIHNIKKPTDVAYVVLRLKCDEFKKANVKSQKKIKEVLMSINAALEVVDQYESLTLCSRRAETLRDMLKNAKKDVESLRDNDD